MTLWAGLTDMWSERRLRRSIVRQFKPLFDYSRALYGREAELRWESDYGVGLIAMLVLLAARRSDPDLGSEALGRLQVDSWTDLTGLDAVEVGTRITLLSTAEDAKFGDGCRAALAFHEADDLNGFAPDDTPAGDVEPRPLDRALMRREMWSRMWQAG